MSEASKILFEELFEGQPLFKNQSDLVIQLLNDPKSPYNIDNKDPEQYSKAQTRLKTYISQLISHSASRVVTEDFKRGLINLLSKKLNYGEAETTAVKLINVLKLKNSRIARVETKTTVRDQLNSDLVNASYIVIITFKPLELDIQSDPGFFSLRNFLFKDLLDRLCDTSKDLKFYRFNFPMDTYGHLFWRGLKRILIQYFTDHLSPTVVESLYSKFTLKTSTINELKNKSQYTIDEILVLVDEVLEMLNMKRYILVFNTKTPIYSIPTIVLNPTDPRHMKIYSVLQSDNDDVGIHKYTEQDCILWRVFVWDKLKSKNFAGEEILYSES